MNTVLDFNAILLLKKNNIKDNIIGIFKISTFKNIKYNKIRLKKYICLFIFNVKYFLYLYLFT